MSGYGFRVQKSAFEAMITENLYKKLLTEIPYLIDKNIDTVRIYKIRGSGEVKLFGVSPKIEDEEVIDFIIEENRRYESDNFIYTGLGEQILFHLQIAKMDQCCIFVDFTNQIKL